MSKRIPYLPPEIIDQIMARSDIQTLGRMASANKSFKTLSLRNISKAEKNSLNIFINNFKNAITFEIPEFLMSNVPQNIETLLIMNIEKILKDILISKKFTTRSGPVVSFKNITFTVFNKDYNVYSANINGDQIIQFISHDNRLMTKRIDEVVIGNIEIRNGIFEFTLYHVV